MFNVPEIRPSSDLRNNYNEISEFCHKYKEPIFLTKNGQGDLAVMSIEAFEQLLGRQELYSLLEKGFDDIKNQRVMPAEEAFKRVEVILNE